MKVKQLQKNTAHEWKKLPIGDVFTFVKSYAFSRDQLFNGLLADGMIGNIHYGDIHATYKTPSIDLSRTEIPMLKSDKNSFGSDDYLKDGDLIMADASEDYDGVGATVSIHGIKNKKVIGGLHTFVLRENKGLTDEYYRQYIFRNPVVRNQLQKIANGVSVYGISKTAVSKIQLLLPSLSEQKRIVSILETWDKTIERLFKKIELKKNIKKGLMQKLLTGKLRLPGFSEEWKKYKLEEIIDNAGDGGTPDRRRPDYFGGGIPWVVIKDIKPKIYGTEESLTELGVRKSSAKIWKKGAIILSTGATIGEVGIAMVEMATKQGITGIELKNGFSNEFIYNWLLTQKQKLIALANGGTFKEIRIKTLEKFEIKLPSSDEQVAIANILILADEEIEMYEQKLERLKDQKKYLLNNLITGTIRTPETIKMKS